jgi:signal transduction histidine kinase
VAESETNEKLVLSLELEAALDRVRAAAGSAASTDSHDRRTSDLKIVIGEARRAVSLSASIAAADGAPEPDAKAEPPVVPSSGIGPTAWLVRSVVHDLNNMLLVIQNCSEAMKNQSSSGVIRREASVVQDAVAQATRLVSKLLPADGPNSGLTGIDLSQTVLRFSGVIRALAGDKIALVTRLASGLPPVQCEETAIARVLSNLSSNARDAMQDGGTLTLETRAGRPAESDSGAPTHAILVVADTGAGMDATTQDKAFEPFFTTKSRGKGSGVGLTSVREIVHGVGGFVEVESAVGQGTTVSVHFPCGSSPAER